MIKRIGRGTKLKSSLLLIVLAAGIVPAVASVARGAAPTGPLTGKVELRFLRCRSGAPIPVVWKLEWTSPAILEGRLEYELYENSRLLARFELPDLVLSNGKNEFKALLPAATVQNSRTSLTLTARFISGSQKFDLEEQSLRVPSRLHRWFGIGLVCGTLSRATDLEKAFVNQMLLESFLPRADALQQSGTAISELENIELPADPLLLCTFDLVVLTPPALAALRDDQAEALRKWVNAGGSLCVITGGGLAPRHALLLNDLVSEGGGREAFVVDSHGFLSPGEAAISPILMARKGLGRVVVVRRPLLDSIAPTAQSWRNASRFLWKLRENPLAGAMQNWIENTLGSSSGGPVVINRNGRMIVRQPRRMGASRGQWNQIMYSELSPPPLENDDGFFHLLMPRGVQTVPLLVIAAVLAAYVLAIGPIDYFLLGLLRLRRFTWLLFPAVTLLFALFTLKLSHWYLGSNDSRRALEIRDVVQGGIEARRSRVELLFLSDERTLTTDVQSGLFTNPPLHSTADVMLPGPSTGPTWMSSDDSLTRPPTFRNRFPGRYAIDQSVAQWTPVLNRFFWIDAQPVKIAGDAQAAPFDWDRLGDTATPAGRQALAQRVLASFGQKACSVVYRQGNVDRITGHFDLMEAWKDLSQQRPAPHGAEQFFRELSARTPERLFALASQVSPSGGPELEDLAIFDPSDPRQSLLVIVVESGSDLILYRRLFFGAT